eukprot:6999706-Heterocapsa_arctica.AAC.1
MPAADQPASQDQEEEMREPGGEVPTDDAEDEGEERALRIPKSTDDIQEHRARAHLPYRSWCGHC